jgi:Fe-S oxidoreductase
MVDKAKRLWERSLETLAPEIVAGTPIVGLEPACVSAFRDELPALFPGNEAAQRLSAQTLFFSEFIERRGADVPHVDGAALVHLHCHHHAVIKPDAEHWLLDCVGLDYEVLNAGCCGMAGSFGFEAGKYDVSIKIAEQALLPRVRGASADTSIIADGFSCREQIEQTTGRSTRHIAEVLANALA